MKQHLRPRTEKVYVKVDTSFDQTGFMQPRSITWADGRTFAIDSVQDFRPASAAGSGHSGDCYTVVIGSQRKYLYFEEVLPHFSGRVGRWYVEAVSNADKRA